MTRWGTCVPAGPSRNTGATPSRVWWSAGNSWRRAFTSNMGRISPRNTQYGEWVALFRVGRCSYNRDEFAAEERSDVRTLPCDPGRHAAARHEPARHHLRRRHPELPGPGWG